ncbi:mannosyl-oligosaccharide alpha-1,2-mannosidase [Coemansia sp. RSA 1286]|nr:mannosyl-oligosaccharide alpha-1,2-mannosidase [Coemansia sp. RSA 1286]
MIQLSFRRWIGGRRRRLLLLIVLCLIVLFYTLSRTNTVIFSRPQPEQAAIWLEYANHIPLAEHEELVATRLARPLVWPEYVSPQWQVTLEQQHELNQVIRQALVTRLGKESNTKEEGLWNSRRQKVKDATKYAWDAYSRDAFGSDEYHPISHTGTNHTSNGIGYFVADVLDTLLLMGLVKEYNQGRDFLVHHVSFDQRGTVSLFETTIRVLGGLLSAFHWSGESDQGILDLAVELGSRLAKSFNTSTGIPPETAILRSDGMAYAYMSSTAEVATLQLEFRYLSKLTGNRKFREQVDKIMQVIFKASKFDGLVPIYINAMTGNFTGDEIRLGSRGDSYYEYLLKQWLQTKQSEPVFREKYDEAMDGVKKYLVDVTPNQRLTIVGELVGLLGGRPKFKPKMDHLVCFLGGNLALGATRGKSLAEISPLSLSARDREDLILARELTETCVHMYLDMPTGLAPEIAHFRHLDRISNTQPPFSAGDQILPPGGDILVSQLDRHNLLRPETIESLLILWRITGEAKWREYGWRIFESFEKWARLESGGYASLADVTVVPPTHQDKMETFFVSETLKYFYLLFSGADKVPLTQYVFNTEAHPLPFFSWN